MRIWKIKKLMLKREKSKMIIPARYTEVLDNILTSAIKERGFSEKAIDVIKKLINNELLCYFEFFKKYID